MENQCDAEIGVDAGETQPQCDLHMSHEGLHAVKTWGYCFKTRKEVLVRILWPIPEEPNA